MSSIRETDAGSDRKFPALITTMERTDRQYKTAFRSFAILLALVAIVLPLASSPSMRAHAFIPVIQTVMCLADLLTATFLFAQYSVRRQLALLALASGFVFSGLFAFLQTLAFPDAYVPGVLIGDVLNSAAWLFVCWHTTFPLAVIIYALTKDTGKTASRSTSIVIGITITCVVAATAGLTWGVTAGAGYLPNLYRTPTEQVPFARGVNIYLTLLRTVAIVLVFIRRRTILDQWLIVTLFAWLPNFAVAMVFPLVRFTVGWYMARVYAFLAGSSVLVILLTETLLLYTRLAKAVVLLQQSEQHQRLLIAELDHRVKNLLAQVAAIITSTSGSSRSIQDFVRSLRGRIRSMAAAHSLLSESRWRSVSLDALVRTELAPYTTGENIRITGGDVKLTAAETQALARVLHELVTNAAKYGALSVPSGQVSVSWDCERKESVATLMIEWRERGGPPVASNIQSSYGTNLIRELVAHELGGKVDLMFASDGVYCGIKFPLTR
jgi:two-component sensor histidine kinase